MVKYDGFSVRCRKQGIPVFMPSFLKYVTLIFTAGIAMLQLGKL